MRIRIDGVIGEDANTAAEISAQLARSRGRPVEVVVNSPGGDAYEGTAIYAELREHPGDVTIRIRGLAASAGSLIAMGGDRIVMADGSLMMLHNPITMAAGDAGTMRQAVSSLDAITRAYAEVYARASGNSLEEIVSWMAAETWLPPEDALALGFVDRIEERIEPEAIAQFDPTRFTNPPAALLDLAEARAAPASPELVQH